MQNHTDTNPFRYAFLRPTYWPIWILMGVLFIIAKLPYPLQFICGHFFGLIIWLLPLPQKKIIRTNIEICYPNLERQKQKKLLFSNCLAMGMSIVEVAMSWWSSDRRLKKIVKVSGLENLESALKQKKGVLILSPHFTTLELGGRLLRLYTPFHVMYRHQNNKLMDYLMLKARRRNFDTAIHRTQIKKLLTSLKQNNPVWYAPDQHFYGKQYVMAPFFGISAASNPATSRLARSSGSKVVPFLQQRLPGLQGYQLELLPALENFPGNEVEKDTTRINHIIEQLVKRVPSQYLWAHKRFKTSLIDGKNPYIP